MKTFTCPLCQLNSATVIMPYRAKTDLFKNKNIVKCNNCGLYSTFPMLSNSDLLRYYNQYWQQYDIDTVFPLFIAQANSRYKFIEPFLPCSKKIDILDVGPGYGLINNSFLMNKIDFNYDVIEIDNQAINFLKSNINPRYFYSSIDQCTNTYQLIIASHILEHYNDFCTILKNISLKLINLGLIMIEVPNQDFLFKPYNEPHVIFFSPETLRQSIQKSNYQIVRIDTCGELISTLADQNLTSPRKGIKSIINKISTTSIKSFLKRFKSNRAEYNYVNQYGGKRQWIRAVAKKIS